MQSFDLYKDIVDIGSTLIKLIDLERSHHHAIVPRIETNGTPPTNFNLQLFNQSLCIIYVDFACMLHIKCGFARMKARELNAGQNMPEPCPMTNNLNE